MVLLRLAVKAVHDMRDFGPVPGIQKADHLESHRCIEAVLFQEVERNAPYPLLLPEVHRLEGLAEPVARAGFYLDEDDGVTVPGDDVGLAKGRLIVSLHDAVALCTQKCRRVVLAASPYPAHGLP